MFSGTARSTRHPYAAIAPCEPVHPTVRRHFTRSIVVLINLPIGFGQYIHAERVFGFPKSFRPHATYTCENVFIGHTSRTNPKDSARKSHFPAKNPSSRLKYTCRHVVDVWHTTHRWRIKLNTGPRNPKTP